MFTSLFLYLLGRLVANSKSDSSVLHKGADIDQSNRTKRTKNVFEMVPLEKEKETFARMGRDDGSVGKTVARSNG